MSTNIIKLKVGDHGGTLVLTDNEQAILITLKKNQSAIIISDENFNSLLDALSDASTFTGIDYYSETLQQSTIIKNQ